MAPSAHTSRSRRAPAAATARLCRTMRTVRAGFPLAATLRGVVALALPLLLGVWTGHMVPAVFAGIGALWGVGQDSSSPYRLRMRRLLAVGLASAVGLLIGELALRSGHTAAVAGCLTATALFAGLISLYGPLRSVAGMHVLLGTTIGSGIPAPGPWWQPPLALLSGVLLVTVLSTSPWLWRRHRIETDSVRAVYRAAATALAAVGTPDAEAARRSMTLALNEAHDVMAADLARATRHRPDDPDTRRLLEALRLAVRLGEVVSALVWEGRPLPPDVAGLPLRMAGGLLPPGKNASAGHGPAPAEKAALARDRRSPAVRALLELSETADAEAGADVILSLPARPRPGRAVRLRYAVLLAGCVLVAYVSALLLHGPRGYWLPMTVAFVYKPDFGPVLRRAVHRCVGTVVGVAAIGAVAALTGDTPYALIATAAAFGALMAVGVRHHYAVATTGLTGIVFVLVDLLGDHRPLYGIRVLDTVLAAVIVLVASFVVWPDSAGDWAAAQTDAALLAVRRYRDLAPNATPARRQALRRAAYRRLADARRAAAQAHAEAVPPKRGLPDWEATIIAAEQVCDAVTAQGLAGTGGATGDDAPESA
ncbi:putative membrane protein YccC [Streptomyces sp. Ag109_O5-1]|uniref:FUSC family protein n=1 Tax=Streptomyces sp. Ag109_O5-1 TaxID=1938851 RepID=UPI000F4DF867|nr:FUSC family protein [Streptomyces sp. Ag109_O5-1]RPE37587.1 putative membrane protein YccC [Streptomyces sp. Ag109_O5-1]